MKYNQGQVSPLILWALGFVATSGFGLTLFGFNSDVRQDKELSTINREVGELGTDIDYIKQGIDDLRRAQGLVKNQTLVP